MSAVVKRPYAVEWQHGTPAGARRHYRHGEKPCPACRAAGNNDTARRSRRAVDPYSQFAIHEPQGQPRNGLQIVPYVYGASRPAFARLAILRAEMLYGTPPEDDEAQAC